MNLFLMLTKIGLFIIPGLVADIIYRLLGKLKISQKNIVEKAWSDISFRRGEKLQSSIIRSTGTNRILL